MSHLTLEALARLVDEAPDAAEEAHLAACGECGAELAALKEQSQTLATLPRMVPPPDAWPALRQRLRDEGLVHHRERWRPAPGAVRAAAAAALFLAGGAAGWAVRGPMAAGSAPGAMAEADAPASDAVPADAPEPAARLASDLPATATGAAPENVERAEEEFLAALDRFMVSTGADASDPAARLAALDNIVLTTAEALNEAPADPVINSYYLMAQAQRRAVLRQIEATAGEPVF